MQGTRRWISAAATLALLGCTQPGPATRTAAAAAPTVAGEPVARDLWLNKPLAQWTQAEREWGFGHLDALGPMRPVRAGSTVRALRTGPAMPGYAAGTDGARRLAAYTADYKLAGLLVLQDGQVRLEHYALGHSAQGKWTSYSVAKSVTSVLVGAALQDGYIQSLDDPIVRYIQGLAGSGYDGVTVRQLLTMTTGVAWKEDYTDTHSDVYRLFNTPPEPGLDATTSYMRHVTRAGPPGKTWRYNTGETNLLGILVREATHKPLAVYASEKIWVPYGMEQDASWMLDATGAEVGGCCLQASTRDYARFGQLVLDGAHIDGRSLVPEGYIEAATRKQADIGRPGAGYGYQWWTRDDGAFDAIGIHGQTLHIDRARRLVIVLNSAWPRATGADLSAARSKLIDDIKALLDREQAGKPLL
jgi:CubicO group peptidase (beta-lactamase class C family)